MAKSVLGSDKRMGYRADSRMMLRDSADLTKPRYLTMFGCWILLVMTGIAMRTKMRNNSIHRDSSKDLSQARAQAISRIQLRFMRWEPYSNHPQFTHGEICKLYLFNCNSFSSPHIQSSEDRTKSAFAETVSKLLGSN